MALHCRCHTRVAVETERLIDNLLATSEWGQNTMGIPLLDDRIYNIWAEQNFHLPCIQEVVGCEAVHPDRQAEQGGNQPAGVQMRAGLHIPRIILPASQPLHTSVPGTFRHFSWMGWCGGMKIGQRPWRRKNACSAHSVAPLQCSLEELSRESSVFEDYTTPREGTHRDRVPVLPNRPSAPEPALQSPGRSSTPPQEPAEEYRGPDDQPGYLAVAELARTLVGLREQAALSERGGRSLDRPLGGLGELSPLLGQANSGAIQVRQAFQPLRPWGGKPKTLPDWGKLRTCHLAQFKPDYGSVCAQNCVSSTPPPFTVIWGVRRSRLDYILMYFHHIRNLVLGSQRLMARAPIQLAEINQRMLSQWYTATLGEKKRLLLALGPGAAAGGLQGPTPAAPSAPALPPPTSPAAAPVLVHRVGPPAAAPVVMHTGQAAPGRRPLLPLSPAPPMYVVLAAPPTAAAAAAGPSSRATVPLLTLTTACPLPSM